MERETASARRANEVETAGPEKHTGGGGLGFRLRWLYRRYRFGDPIVVASGLPRSGTSMLMQMLASGGMPVVTDAARAADEDNPAGYYEDERVKDLPRNPDKSWLREARGKAIKIVSPILGQLPADNNYLVIFVRRDLNEVLASQVKMLERRGRSAEPSDEQMARLFEDNVRRTRALLASRPQFDSIEIGYTEVVAEPRSAARRIAAFLRRPLDVERMASVVDARLHRNRR